MIRSFMIALVMIALVAVPTVEAQRSGQNASISIGVVIKVEDINLQSQVAPAGALMGGMLAYKSTGSSRSSATKWGRAAAGAAAGGAIGRAAEGQDRIYYLLADSYARAVSSPHIEKLRDAGVEVLLLTDRVDEWLVSHFTDYKGKHLQSVAKGELDLGDPLGGRDVAVQAGHDQPDRIAVLGREGFAVHRDREHRVPTVHDHRRRRAAVTSRRSPHRIRRPSPG